MGSYEDYAQALEFDQLNALMKEGTVLNGFTANGKMLGHLGIFVMSGVFGTNNRFW